jgi:hypothetical protein
MLTLQRQDLHLLARPLTQICIIFRDNGPNPIRRTPHTKFSLRIRESLTSRAVETLGINNRRGDHAANKRRVRREEEDRVVGGYLTLDSELRGAIELHSDGWGRGGCCSEGGGGC